MLTNFIIEKQREKPVEDKCSDKCKRNKKIYGAIDK